MARSIVSPYSRDYQFTTSILLSTSSSTFRRFEIYAQRLPFEFLSIQSRYCGSRLMTFHLDKTESLALIAKHIQSKLNGADSSKFRKKIC